MKTTTTNELTEIRAEGYLLITRNSELQAQYNAEVKALNERYQPQFQLIQTRLNEIQARELELTQ